MKTVCDLVTESVDVEGLVKVVRKPTLSRQTKQSAIGIMASLAHFFPVSTPPMSTIIWFDISVHH